MSEMRLTKTGLLLGLLYVSFLMLFSSCSNSLDPENYVKWMKDESNGLYAATESGAFKFQLAYQPQEFVALKNYKTLKSLPLKDKWQAELKEHAEFQYYNLKISAPGMGNFLKADLVDDQDYYRRIAYFSNYAQMDFKLVEGQDTLPCIMYHFERNYGIQPFHNILLGFANDDSKKSLDRELIYLDRALGLTPVKLKIEKENFQQIPQLKL